MLLQTAALVFLVLVLAWCFVSIAWWLTYGAYARVQIWRRFRFYVRRSRRRCWMCEHPRRRISWQDGLCRQCRPLYKALSEVA